MKDNMKSYNIMRVISWKRNELGDKVQRLIHYFTRYKLTTIRSFIKIEFCLLHQEKYLFEQLCFIMFYFCLGSTLCLLPWSLLLFQSMWKWLSILLSQRNNSFCLCLNICIIFTLLCFRSKLSIKSIMRLDTAWWIIHSSQLNVLLAGGPEKLRHRQKTFGRCIALVFPVLFASGS